MNSKMFLRATIFLFAAQLFLSGPLLAQPQIFSVRKEDSHIGFAIYKWKVFKEEGRFKNFTGAIIYDPKNPAASQVEFTVQANSIDSRNTDRDGALRSKEFFNVAQYPTLGFKSRQVAKKGADTLLVTGDLTMRGVTKPITIPVKLLGVNRVGDMGRLRIDLRDQSRRFWHRARLGYHRQRGDDSFDDWRGQQSQFSAALIIDRSLTATGQ